MQLKPLYRAQFEYPQQWGVDIKGENGTEEQLFLAAEGNVDGRIQGRLHGANFPRRRVDKTAVTDFRGVIETHDGAVIVFEYHGYGRAHTPEHDRVAGPNRRQWVATALHVSHDDRYRWLNDVVCVGAGEVRVEGGQSERRDSTTIVIDFSELVWEPLAE